MALRGRGEIGQMAQWGCPSCSPVGMGTYAHMADYRKEMLTMGGCLEDLRHGQHDSGRRRSYGDPGEDVDWEVDAKVDAGDDDE